MLRTSKRRRLSPDTCLPVLTRSELRWLDRSGPLNSCSWRNLSQVRHSVPIATMPSQTDTTLHIDGLTWALRRLGAGCVGKLSAVAPSAKSQMSRGGSRWLPVSLVSPQRSLEVAWGTHNRPRTSSVPPTYVLPSTTLCFTQQDIECVHLLSCS